MLRRVELVDVIFQLLDSNADGILHQNELHRFAMLTGFDGSDSDWATEYGLLCEHVGLDVERGVDAATFSRLVDDASTCYCTYDELEGVVRRLREDYGTGDNFYKLKDKARRSNKIQRNRAVQPSLEVAVTPSPSSPSGAAPGPCHRALTGRRDVAEQGGCHGNNEELEQICERLQTDTDLHKRAEASLESKRQELIRQVFCACDASGDGVLSCHEMEGFAKCTGFQGDKEAWQNEYKLLCSDNGVNPQDGINCSILGKIVNDATSKGCYCSSEELESILDRLKGENNARHPPRTALATKANEANRIRPQRSSDFVEEVQEKATESLIAPPKLPAFMELFRLLDQGGDGLLDEEELYRLASLTGFTGSAQDWSQGYHKVCAGRGVDPAKGLDVFHFEDFVTDRSERGCYFSEQELETLIQVVSRTGSCTTGFGYSNSWVQDLRLLRQLELAHAPVARRGASRPGAAGPAAWPAPPRPPAPQVDLRYLSRGELVREVFNACDTDGDGRLSEGDLFNFAQVTGFNGPREAWKTEFLSLCLDTGADASMGINITVFEQLVNDRSNHGCYCLDQELRSMLPLLWQLREAYPRYLLR